MLVARRPSRIGRLWSDPVAAINRPAPGGAIANEKPYPLNAAPGKGEIFDAGPITREASKMAVRQRAYYSGTWRNCNLGQLSRVRRLRTGMVEEKEAKPSGLSEVPAKSAGD